MLLKILGVIFVIASSSLIGQMICKRLEYRLSDLRDTKLALSILQSEISYLMNSLPEALKNASKVDGNISKIFLSCEKLLNQKIGYCSRDAWNISVNENYKYTYLSDSDKEILLSLGKNLGLYDLEKQICNIKSISMQLDNQENHVKEVIEKNSKMYKSLSFLAGIAISIILIWIFSIFTNRGVKNGSNSDYKFRTYCSIYCSYY